MGQAVHFTMAGFLSPGNEQTDMWADAYAVPITRGTIRIANYSTYLLMDV